MIVMASARDLITIFIALELLSIPAYMLAAWRKRDLKSNEAGLKYYLMGVFASAILLYGMSLLYGLTGTTKLAEIAATSADLAQGDAASSRWPSCSSSSASRFKVSAVPFHTWAPDTYEGAPTPVTAFLAVASKTAGFVALLILRVRRASPAAPGRRLRADDLGALHRHHVRRQPHRPAPDQRGAHARLLRYRAGRLHAGAARRGRRQPRSGGHGAAVDRHLPRDLRGDEPRRLRRHHRRGPQDQVGRAQLLRWALPVRAGAGRGDDDLPVLAGRHPAARRAGSPSSRIFQRPGLEPGTTVGLRAGRHRRHQLGDRPLLLRPNRAGHVDGRRPRRRRRSHPGAGRRSTPPSPSPWRSPSRSVCCRRWSPT